MSAKFADLPSISELHELYQYGKPKHPLITLIDLSEVNRTLLASDVLYRLGFYTVFYKHFKGVIRYGRAHYDFNEGSLMFTAPGQVISPDPYTPIEEGWGLCFHADLLNRSELGKRMDNYSFFNYETNEALHISADEKKIIEDCVKNIEREYTQNIDKHTQSLITDNIQLLLDYCTRFYERQFFTRSITNNDLVQRFEHFLHDYFSQSSMIETGLPDVKFFAAKLNLSPNYLSDLLQKYTGKSALEHIHLQVINKAKSLLWGTERSISEIAYELGFEHASHFTKLFKSKTGQSPSVFREMN